MKQRHEYRQFILDAWQKHAEQQPLSQLETQLVDIILEHPEYHQIFAEADLAKDFRTDNNPYLHISLHLSLNGQLATNRPDGITAIYQQLLKKWQNRQQVEHVMMDAMARILWEAEQKSVMPKDEDYLVELRALLQKKG